MQTDTVFKDVHEHAESIKNDGEHHPTMEPGDTWAQGDIGITRLDELPGGLVKIDRPQLQLAPGTTQGSRHCLRSLDGVTQYAIKRASPLDGPIFEAIKQCAVDHPEHGNVILDPGIYAITYQRAYAEKLRRIQD